MKSNARLGIKVIKLHILGTLALQFTHLLDQLLQCRPLGISSGLARRTSRKLGGTKKRVEDASRGDWWSAGINNLF